MQQTLFNSSLLFFPCSVSNKQKMFWKVGVSKFFVEVLEKHQGRISFFLYCCRLDGYIFNTKIIRSRSELQLATMQCRYFKKDIFFSTTSVFASIDYNTVFSPISGHRWRIKKLSANQRCPPFGKFFNIGLNFENKVFFYIYKV